MMVQLDRAEIDAAIGLGEKTLAKYKNNLGKKYDNNLNSHVKGRLGEFALETWLVEHKISALCHFKEDISERLCDIEIMSAHNFKRVEIKTWSLEFWSAWGRCIAVKQMSKVQKQSDGILWCRVDLPKIKTVEQLKTLNAVDVELFAYSIPADCAAAPKRMTGPYGREVFNHQLEDSDLRNIEEFLADLSAGS